MFSTLRATAIVSLMALATSHTFAAVSPNDSQTLTQRVPETVRRSGPRVGMTTLTGKLAEGLKQRYGAEPLFSQFGWQFEQEMASGAEGGVSVIFHQVFLVGGLDQNLFVPGATFLLGLRTPSGVEFGVGPNILYNVTEARKEDATLDTILKTSVVLAMGVSIPAGRFLFPIDFAFSPATTGLRTTVMAGVAW